MSRGKNKDRRDKKEKVKKEKIKHPPQEQGKHVTTLPSEFTVVMDIRLGQDFQKGRSGFALFNFWVSNMTP